MILHIARIQPKNRDIVYLFLCKNGEKGFRWFLKNQVETPIATQSLEEAITLASKHWKEMHFRTVFCGTLFSLLYRDSVGKNALFWQMVLSYESPNGQYFDPKMGCKAFVDFASDEALSIWRKGKNEASHKH